MGAKRTPTKVVSKPKPKPASRLQNLAARPPQFGEDAEDEQLVDNSGVFRVTSAIAQAQTGHAEDDATMFPNESLVMRAQKSGYGDDGPTLDEAVEERRVVDEAARAEKKARLATLVARGQAKTRR